MDDVDYTGGKALAELADELHDQHIQLAVAGVSVTVRQELDALGVSAAIGREHVYDDIEDAIAAFRATAGG